MNGCGMRAECCRDQWKQTGLKHLFTLCLAIKSKATLTRLTFQQFNEGAKGPAGCTATVCVCFIKTCTQICTWKRSHGTHSYSICVWGCTHVSLHVCRARLHMCVYSYFTVRPQSSIPLPPSLLLLCGSVCINRTIWKASAAGPGMLTGCFVTLHPQECVAVCKCEGVREWVKGWDRHGEREREEGAVCMLV